MADDVNELNNEIRSLIKECLYLSNDDQLQISLFKLRNMCEYYFTMLEGKSAPNSNDLLNFEKEIYILWNVISENCEKYSKECVATVNYLVTRLVKLFTNSKTELSVSKKLTFIKLATTTARVLLENDQIERACNVLDESELLLTSLGNAEKKNEIKFKKFEFFNQISRIDICVRNGQDEAAIQQVDKTKSLLDVLEDECRVYLSSFCYNLGLEFYGDKFYEKSVVWLRSAYEIGIDTPTLKPRVNLSLILNLLAEVYLQWNEPEHWHKALDAIQLCEKYGDSNKFLKVKIMLASNESDSNILKCIFNWMESKPQDHDVYEVLNYILKYEHFSVLPDLITLLENNEDKKEAGKYVCFLLQNINEDSLFDKMCPFFEKLIQQRKINFSEENASILCILCLQRGQHCHQKLNVPECLNWYRYSEHFTLYAPQYKLQIIRSKCLYYIQMEDIQNATSELHQLNSGEEIDYFLQFRLAILERDNKCALEAINKLNSFDSSDKLGKLMCIAVKQTLKCENSQEFVVNLLEMIIERHKHNIVCVVSTKILLRLVLLNTDNLNDETYARIFHHLDVVYQFIYNFKSGESQLENDIQWFSNISWNLALHTSASLQHIFSSFHVCSLFLALSSLNCEAFLMNKLVTFLLTCAAGLELAQNYSNIDEKNVYYLNVINLVTECESVISQFIALNLFDNIKVESMKKSVLLYKLEAHSRVDDNLKAFQVFDEIFSLANMDVATLEKLISICVNFNDENLWKLKERILEYSTCELANIQPLDMEKWCQYNRLLISTLLEKFSFPCNNEKLWRVCEKAVHFILNQNVQLEIEVLWLMVSIWNVGIDYFLNGQIQVARNWCSLASKLLPKLPTTNTNYKEKILTVLKTQNWDL